MCEPNTNSNNTFKGYNVTIRRSYTGDKFNYVVFSDENSWIDVNIPNIANQMKERFTIEAWVKINSADANSLDNAILFSIGDKFVVRLGSGSDRNKIYIEKFNEETQTNNTNAVALKYNM
jgi:Rps23 Pro-64 3,4-dihydroxylase Tpa1-like proline 4-hydroxylase